MSVERHYRSLLSTVSVYEKLLVKVSEEEFIQSPQDGGWSYSETYSHIFQSNLLSLLAIEKCIAGIGVPNRKRIHWLAWLILFFGRFPPVKFKAPAKIAAMTKKISREDALDLISKFKIRLGEVKSKIHQADSFQKSKHPRLGLLNAEEWFRFIEVHTVHHTRQLRKIGRRLKS
ncbi:MAG: DinB family protein [Daejeonella sp.]|uniref:DinB family protein n=1 Tax=Daejeonella sp. TaxID=2805397 RepID=UPI0027322CDC|nr:DinB family protein [Daejeonella sp.]MDP3469189.1 DinB family protein [Daejeonella sp.]